MNATARLWTIARRVPGGRRAFSRGVGLRVPYFATVRPTIHELGPGYCVATVPLRRRVRNHLGTMHAIASCNAAEIVMGLAADAAVPPTHRWIPTGMTVQYLAQARTGVTAATDFTVPAELGDEPLDLPVPVTVRDDLGLAVVTATITIRITPRP